MEAFKNPWDSTYRVIKPGGRRVFKRMDDPGCRDPEMKWLARSETPPIDVKKKGRDGKEEEESKTSTMWEEGRKILSPAVQER
jgi:hypothetical protein